MKVIKITKIEEYLNNYQSKLKNFNDKILAKKIEKNLMENKTNYSNNHVDSLKNNVYNYNQEHLLDFINLITDDEKRQNYLDQLNGIDYKFMKNLFEIYLSKSNEKTSAYNSEDFSPIDSNFVKDSFTKSEYDHLFSQMNI